MAGIYIHVPFCKKACHYCNFHFSTSLKLKNSLITAICKEIEFRKDYLKNEQIESIYLGGGTPSILNEHDLSLLFEQLLKYFTINELPEITLEANPDDINRQALKIWKRVGINRLSIGIQSFFDEDLQWMNRAHDSIQARQCINMARSSGIEQISADLIYGLPNSTMKRWQQNLEQMINFSPNHISSYCLTIEPSTALAHFVKQGKVSPLHDDETAKQFLWSSRQLEHEGYDHYEVSNFARNSNYAVHNTSYWTHKNYIGFGPSAHSFNGNCRQWNIANNAKYIKLIEENTSYFEIEVLTDSDKYNEHIMTGFRTKKGVSLRYIENLGEIYLSTFLSELHLKKWDSYLFKENTQIKLTREGWLYADRIASDFFLTNEGN
jgi:oxygen-independent coproporphyrinogen-3 oxidase